MRQTEILNSGGSQGDGNSDSSDYSAEEDNEDSDGDEYDEGVQKKQKVNYGRGRDGKERPVPPLLARVGGNIEVLGFNSRWGLVSCVYIYMVGVFGSGLGLNSRRISWKFRKSWFKMKNKFV